MIPMNNFFKVNNIVIRKLGNIGQAITTGSSKNTTTISSDTHTLRLDIGTTQCHVDTGITKSAHDNPLCSYPYKDFGQYHS